MYKLIINADDFGLDEGVNRGIAVSFTRGILSSTTILANGSAFEDAVEQVRKNPVIRTGIHFNILRGFPIADKTVVAGLLDKDGSFLKDIRKLLLRLSLGRIKEDQLERELSAQIEKVLSAGLKITHLDSEKHLHLFPAVFKVVVRVSAKYGINKIRLINESLITPGFPLFRPQYYKMKILNRLSRKNKTLLDREKMLYPEYFFGVLSSGSMTKEFFKNIISNLKDGITEIMCHPGYLSTKKTDQSFGSYYLDSKRELELDALLDPEVKTWLTDNNVALISYGEIS